MGFIVEQAIIQAIDSERIQKREMIADQLDIGVSTFHRHMTRLVERGIVEKRGNGRRGAYVYIVNREKAIEAGYTLA